MFQTTNQYFMGYVIELDISRGKWDVLWDINWIFRGV
jgi:hypothetical protein